MFIKTKIMLQNILRTKKLFDQYHFFGANKFTGKSLTFDPRISFIITDCEKICEGLKQ